jgi:hypothetical protein
MRIGLLWREEWDSETVRAEERKLRGVFAAFHELGVDAEPVVYADDRAETVREALVGLDGVLVWVNPIEKGLDRSKLDPVLRAVADAGVFVSAHPDVILLMGTKQVLVDTREMGWGTDTRLYRTLDELRAGLSARPEAGPVVLKRYRGMGGNGVWKVELDGAAVIAQHALGGASPERLAVEQFLEICAPYFDDGSPMVEQPYQPRLPEGMIRAYLVHDRVVGFTRQFPRGLMPPGEDDRPTSKLFEPASADPYRRLRSLLEERWVPELLEILGLDAHSLPVIWDADFLYGPIDPHGEDTFVLCEINVSSTFAFPEFAMPAVAEAAVAEISRTSGRSGSRPGGA